MRQKKRILKLDPLPPPGRRIGVAVSGGADSVALLRLLLEYAPEHGFVLSVIHVNHLLRGRRSHEDESFVRKLAAKYRLEFFVKRIDIGAIAKKSKQNVEEVARRERYAFFRELAESRRVDRVAVAHTADDQAETVLSHILRGSGLAGLAGIHVESGPVFRPLLKIRRAELRSYLRSLRQPWREDQTNRDTTRTRARIRHKLLPLLEKSFNPGVVPHLCQLAELARIDEAFLDDQAARHELALTTEREGGRFLELAAFGKLHPALQARVLRRVLQSVKPNRGQISAVHLTAVLDLARGAESGKLLQLPGGVEIRRDRDHLRIVPQNSSRTATENRTPAPYELPLELPLESCTVRLMELSCVLRFRVIDWPPEGGETSLTGAVLDCSRLASPMVVRSWRPGDAMRPAGHQKTHTLARLLNEKSVSRWEKATWPVLIIAGRPAWVRGLPVAADFAVSSQTRTALWIVEEPDT